MKDLEVQDESMGINGVPSDTPTAGVGYVIVPKGVDAKSYIEKCYKSNTISMYSGFGGGHYHNVSVDDEVMQKLSFPDSPDKYGSPVVWVNIPKHNKPLIIASVKYDDDTYELETNSRRITKSFNGNMIDIFLKANSSTIDVNVVGNDDTSPKVKINVINEKADSEVKLYVKGTIILHSTDRQVLVSDKAVQFSVIDSSGKIKGLIKYVLGEGFTYKDEFGNIHLMNSDNIQFKPNEKFKVGDGNEPAMLGNTFKSIFEDLTDILSKLANSLATDTHSDSMGGTGTSTNAANFTKLASDINSMKDKYKDFLSGINFTD